MGDEIIAIIPARSGSKGVPHKNIKPLAGRPLIAYSIMAARLTGEIDRVIVSTDSDHYAEIAREYGAEVPFRRPSEFAEDHVGDYEVIRHTLDWMKENEGHLPQYIVHLRPVTPLREAKHIQAAIELIKKNPQATALRSAHEMSETAYKTLEIEEGYFKCLCTGSFDIEAANRVRQEYPETYLPNGYVDVLKTSYVMEHEKAHGDRVIAYLTPNATDIDTLDDFHYLEYQIEKNPEILQQLFGS